MPKTRCAAKGQDDRFFRQGTRQLPVYDQDYYYDRRDDDPADIVGDQDPIGSERFAGYGS